MLLSFLSLTLQSEWNLSASQTANMTACVFAGSLVGTLTLGYLGDHVGRRPAFLLSTAIISLFGVFTAFATGVSGELLFLCLSSSYKTAYTCPSSCSMQVYLLFDSWLGLE